MPAEGLVELTGANAREEEVARAADHYLASEQVVEHQIRNQLRAREEY